MAPHPCAEQTPAVNPRPSHNWTVPGAHAEAAARVQIRKDSPATVHYSSIPGNAAPARAGLQPSFGAKRPNSRRAPAS